MNTHYERLLAEIASAETNMILATVGAVGVGVAILGLFLTVLRISDRR